MSYCLGCGRDLGPDSHGNEDVPAYRIQRPWQHLRALGPEIAYVCVGCLPSFAQREMEKLKMARSER